MDFFERQHQAQKKTGLLVFLFAMAVVGIVVVLDVIFSQLFEVPWNDPQLILGVVTGVLVMVGGGSLMKMIELSKGGRIVAAMLGGEPVSPHTIEPGERRLLNVVEEMAIASGVPVPEIYVLPDGSINAFAAGHGPGDTAIGITRGALNHLTREELQGVIAHEFSHILHGDMRLNIRLMALLHGILALALLGGLLMRSTFYVRGGGEDSNDGDRKNSGAGGIIFLLLATGLTLYLIGWIGVFFGNLIKAAVSRQREFLADASAVQYTRNPQGIAGALYKISRFTARLMSPRAAEASHMFFGNGLGDPWLRLFATHPPVMERISAIAPDFDPTSMGPLLASPPPLPGQPIPQIRQTTPEAVFRHADIPQTGLAAALLASLPGFTREATRELHSAAALVYALLLDEDEEIRAAQIEALEAPVGIREEALAFFQKRKEITEAGRIALVDLAIPTLRQLSAEQYRDFRANVQRLSEQDGRIDLFEFVLRKILLRHLDLYFSQSTGAKIKYRSMAPIADEVEILLGAVALSGHSDPAEQRDAFETGLRELLFKPSDRTFSLPATNALDKIDSALDHLAEASPEVKRRVLKACAAAAAQDGRIQDVEYELLRAIADAVDCPLPPLPAPDPGATPHEAL